MSEVNQHVGSRKWKFERRTVMARSVNDIHCIDLIDLSKKKTTWKYLMVSVDIYSRYCHVVKMHTKTSDDIQKALKECWKEMGKPKKIWSDMESGLESNETKAFLEDNDVEVYHTNNSYIGPGSHANPIAERMNKTIKESYIEKQTGNFNAMVTKGVEKVNEEYNERVHRTIGTTPEEAKNGDIDIRQDNEARAREPVTRGPRYKIGDEVLLQKKKETIGAKYKNTYKGPYKIIEVRKTRPITYILEGVKGSIYGQQIKKYKPRRQVRIEDADTEPEDDDTEKESDEETATMKLRGGKIIKKK